MNDAPVQVTLRQVIEALLFAAPKSLTAKQLAALCNRGAAAAGPSPVETETSANGTPSSEPVETEKPALHFMAETTEEQVAATLAELAENYAAANGGLWIQEVAGGYRLGTRAETAPWVRRLFDEVRPAKLSQPAMETLAIIAYRQPISRADVEAVRGVAIDGVVATLLERRLIRLAGRSDTPGRALLYETTPEFLELFGLRNLDELPNATELRHIPPPPPTPVPAQTEEVEATPAETS